MTRGYSIGETRGRSEPHPFNDIEPADEGGLILKGRLFDRNERHNVSDLESALDAYWDAYGSSRAGQAAYHEILLFGGKDGYPPTESRWRLALARWLRLLALKVERRFGK